METIAPLALLALISLVVLFVAVWRPTPVRVREPAPTMDEIPIVAVGGAPLVRGTEEREAAMREAVRLSGLVPKREWVAVAPNLLFVPDDASDNDLARLLTVVGGTEVTADEIADDEGEVSARERFRRLLASRGWNDRVIPLGTHLAPGPFDAYRPKGAL